jgi:hypothetical protein
MRSAFGVCCLLSTAGVSAVLADHGAATPESQLPNYHGCASALAQSFQYCNMTLSHSERVDSLLGLLSLDEKIGLIAPDPSLGSTCFAHIHAIPRVGLPEYGETMPGAPARSILSVRLSMRVRLSATCAQAG